MTVIRVFDPAMCCSTGVCGPSVDPQLSRFAADLDWLRTQGVSVERFNLSQQPAAFADAADVRAVLETKGPEGLPVVQVSGTITSAGVYPSRDELTAWAGLRALPDASKKPSTPIMLKTVASGCCEPATGLASDSAGPKSSNCC